MRLNTTKKLFCYFVITLFLVIPHASVLTQGTFNPQFIISDTEIQDLGNWTRYDIQSFLNEKGSYLSTFTAPDTSGLLKPAADIIYEAAQNYQINPKFLLVTLQKEQSLITDDSPSQKQLDWATGYAVCDSCNLNDPNVQKHKGFGQQVDNAAGLMRWYYENKDKSYIKKINVPTIIDGQQIIPQSWATAFLYTYTPHLHGNQNFWRIWNTWFAQIYPNGSLLQFASSTDVWLVQNGQKRKFKNLTVLTSRADPKMIITVPESELNNYQTGTDLNFPNYSLLTTNGATYLLDYDTLRPFASAEVIRKIGYNPEEIVTVNDTDLTGYAIGPTITEATIAPAGVIYQITDLKNTYYLLKDNVLHPITDKKIITINYQTLKIEKHTLKDMTNFIIADLPAQIADGTLIKAIDSNKTYVVESGKKRRIADDETFIAMGYNKNNVAVVANLTAANIPEGETIFLNSALLSAKNKFLGDSTLPVADLFKTKLPAYLVAEYPSGRIIAGKDIDTPRPIASFTKILTAYEALAQNFDLKKTTVYKKSEYASSGNPLSLIDGEKLYNKDIFTAMLVSSVNNTARMVAKNSGLTENDFISSINTRLYDWGANDTIITDVTGLSAGNISTPRNLLKIFTKTLANATIKEALAKTEYTFKEALNKNKIANHRLTTTNLITKIANRNYNVLASKTGYTDEAKSVLIMLVESRMDKKQYIIITMGNIDYKNKFSEPNNIAKWISTGKIKIAAD